MVELLMLFIRATRENNWELHQSAVRSMLPWFFAMDQVNYGRYGVYWLEMTSLDITHPGILVRKYWTCQQQTRYGFSATPCDQAMEQTFNPDSKTKGGIVRFILNRSAVQRWILAQSERGAMTRQCYALAGFSEEKRSRKDLDVRQMKHHNSEVHAVIITVENMKNPFDDNLKDLVNIVTGEIAKPSVKNNLLQSSQIGEKNSTNLLPQKSTSQALTFFLRFREPT
eukprot:gene1921-2178_t